MFRVAFVFILFFSPVSPLKERKKEGRKERKENKTWLVPYLTGSNSENNLDGALGSAEEESAAPFPATALVVGTTRVTQKEAEIFCAHGLWFPFLHLSADQCPGRSWQPLWGHRALTPGFEHCASLGTLPSVPTLPFVTLN